MATYSQLSAAFLLMPFLPFAIPRQTPSILAIGCVAALAVCSTALAYLLYFYLIAECGSDQGHDGYLSCTGFWHVLRRCSAWGAAWLGNLAGFGLILASVTMVGKTPQRTRASERMAEQN